MVDQQFCLRWNNHQTNLLSVFEKLLSKESFVDVTLACEGKSIKAHKVVLSACSPFFEEILENNPCKHPVIILKDLQYADLKAIVQFMYKGEVNISQEQLTQLIRTAEALKIKGLAEMGSDDQNQSDVPPKASSPPPHDPQIQSVKRKRDNSSPVPTPRQFSNKDVPSQVRQAVTEPRHSSSTHPESPSFANVKFSRVRSSSPQHADRSLPTLSMPSTASVSQKRSDDSFHTPPEFTNSPEVTPSVPQASVVKREPSPQLDDPEDQIEQSQTEYLMDSACEQDLGLEQDFDSRTSQNEYKTEIQYEEVNLSDSPPPDLPMGMSYDETITGTPGGSSGPSAGPSQLDSNNSEQLSAMGPKKVTDNEGKKKRMLSMETKMEIIKKYESGMRLSAIAKEYDRNPSTIGTILKQREAIKAATPSKGVTVLSSKRSHVHNEMERLLLLWIKDKEIVGDTITESIICRKASTIFSNLLKVQAEEEDGTEGTSEQHAPPKFKASRGWFDKFKKRTGIHSVVRHGEAPVLDFEFKFKC